MIPTANMRLTNPCPWTCSACVQRLMALVQSSCSEQPFPLFTALMRHSSAPGLGPDERVVVINLALQQVRGRVLMRSCLPVVKMQQVVASLCGRGGVRVQSYLSSTSLPHAHSALSRALVALQPSVYSLSAFSMALQELPRALTADANAATTALHNAVMGAVRKLAQEVGDAGQMCEAISSVLRQHATPSKTAQVRALGAHTRP